ncbi:MAG: ribonuclease HII [Saprospiraceae bacterium]|nr:ribonuclease HII [Saprospiraceae bacterium]
MLPSRLNKKLLEAGCDEAGRGCLAGPVFAAAVILPQNFSHPILNDSKILNKNEREELREIIIREAISFGISFCQPSTIDRINILNASFEAMHLAIRKLDPQPEQLLIDGNRFKPFGNTPFACLVKGDSKIGSIAAASILAKTSRDRYMERQHIKFPDYAWYTNKGYPTEEHRNAIIQHGLTPLHRRSFRQYPLPAQGTLF